MADFIRRFVATSILDARKDTGREALFELRLSEDGYFVSAGHLGGRWPYLEEIVWALRELVLTEYPAYFGRPFAVPSFRDRPYRFVQEQQDDGTTVILLEEADSLNDPYPVRRTLLECTARGKVNSLFCRATDLLDLLVASGWLQFVYDKELRQSVYLPVKPPYEERLDALKVEVVPARILKDEPGWLRPEDQGTPLLKWELVDASCVAYSRSTSDTLAEDPAGDCGSYDYYNLHPEDLYDLPDAH